MWMGCFIEIDFQIVSVVYIDLWYWY